MCVGIVLEEEGSGCEAGEERGMGIAVDFVGDGVEAMLDKDLPPAMGGVELNEPAGGTLAAG